MGEFATANSLENNIDGEKMENVLKLGNIKLPVDYNDKIVIRKIAELLKIPSKFILQYAFVRLSVDARKKENVHYLASVNVTVDDSKVNIQQLINKNKKLSLSLAKAYHYEIVRISVEKKPAFSPVIVGAGPCGLFCGLILAQSGLNPIIIERGKPVDQRQKDIETFWNSGILDENSNIQFGEGGAGTFSDGKLNTGVNDVRSRKVLEEFVRHGSPKEILYQAKPHIGTDNLPRTVSNIRKEIIRLGGKVLFATQLTDISVKNHKVCAITVQHKNSMQKIECDTLVLALGHSARDTFAMLNTLNIPMQQKPFSVGVRIEHLQEKINRSQYGNFADKGHLKSADYKLSTHLPNGRGVYTFCMCPGGTVVGKKKKKERLVTNGMSKFARNEVNANSALLVGVDTKDFQSEDVLAGVEFQRKLEEKAFALGGYSYKAPVQRTDDFIHNRKTVRFGEVFPSYTAKTEMANLNEILPEYVSQSLKSGILDFEHRLKGFSDGDAVLTGVETRSSSPIRILRNERMQSIAIEGLYPCGEGAGYAGGIMSAAIDGIKCAEMIIQKLQQGE